MKHKITKVLCLGLVLILLLSAFTVGASEEKSQAESLYDAILHYEMQKAGVDSLQEFVDEVMAKDPISGAEWYCLALKKNFPSLDFSRYAKALADYCENNREASAVTRKKLALVLLALGEEEHSLVGDMRNEELAGQGVMNYVFALHLLNNKLSLAGYTAEALVELLLARQLEDGGWALSGTVSDPDVTAMVLQAIACHKENEMVATAIDKALSRLSDLQKPDGDFASYGVTNPESTAQVMMALVSLGIDPLGDERFVKGENTLLDGMMKYRLADGSFCHSEAGAFNQNATVQVFCALSVLREGGSLYEIGDFSSLALPSVTPSDTEHEVADDAGLHWKWYAVGGVIIVAALLLLLLLIQKKKSLAFLVLVVSGVLILLLLVVKIQTVDDYYRYEEPENPIGKVTFAIRCDAVAGRDSLPKDGVMLKEASYSIGEGDTVYDLLLRVSKANQIPVVASGSHSAYVSGIGSLYEAAYGEVSGWVYSVNGENPSDACNQFILKDGDVVVFSYTLTLGVME